MHPFAEDEHRQYRYRRLVRKPGYTEFGRHAGPGFEYYQYHEYYESRNVDQNRFETEEYEGDENDTEHDEDVRLERGMDRGQQNVGATTRVPQLGFVVVIGIATRFFTSAITSSSSAESYRTEILDSESPPV